MFATNAPATDASPLSFTDQSADVYPDNHRPVQPLHDREVFAVPAA